MKNIKIVLAFASFTMLGFGQSIIVKSPAATGVTPPLSSLTGQVAPANVAGQYDKTRLDKATMVADHIGKLSAPSLSISGVNTPFQTILGTLPVTVTKNFQGMGCGYDANWVDQFLLPPDTTMAVGPNYIVQWVNVRLSIMDKSGTPWLAAHWDI